MEMSEFLVSKMHNRAKNHPEISKYNDSNVAGYMERYKAKFKFIDC
jgi:hypothetical protein